MKYYIGIIVAVLIIAAGWHVLDTEHKHHDHDHDHGEHHDEHEHDHELPTAAELVPQEPVRADGTFTIAASFYPLAFALESLTAGVNDVEVINIGGARDPHDVQLSTTDVRTLREADLVVMQGAFLEPWGEEITEQFSEEGIPVLIATEGLALHESGHDEHGDEHKDEHDDEHHEENDHEHEDAHDEDHHDEEEDGHHDDHGHNHGAYDPHTWLDPVLFSESVATMATVLATFDPENAALYETRAAELTATLTALDTAYTSRLATCALDEVITSHDAFGYLGERYGFTIHAIGGLSTQDLPSTQTLAELKEEAEEGIGAILLEENSIKAYGETLAAETGLRTLSVNPIAYAIPEGEDYVSVMESNLAVFADALQCE